MESELTFVAREGVYSLTEDHKSIPVAHTAPHPLYPTRLSTITVRFPATKQPAIQGLGQLLGGGKESRKEKGLAPTPPAKNDGSSVLSGDTLESPPQMLAVCRMPPPHQHRLLCPIRTMDSLARLQVASAGRYLVRNIICARLLRRSSLDYCMWTVLQRCCRQNRER